MTTAMSMPREIVEEILLKLPVKSLVRFSSVSKAWNSMISESSWFVKRYRPNFKPERIFLTPVDCSSISLSSTDTKKEYFVCPFSKSPCLLASCNELLLTYDEDGKYLFLWNPSMGTYKRLSPCCSNVFDFVYGLGYDSTADNYKILKIPGFNSSPEVHLYLYSLKSDSWRDILNFSTHRDTYLPKKREPTCVFVSGNFHWLRLCADDRVNIISFDLSTEKLGQVAQPNYSYSLSEYDGQICVLKGMLCVSLLYGAYYDRVFKEARCDIWVMKDYGVVTSWTKMFSIKQFSYEHSPDYVFGRVVPLYIYENGELLFRASKVFQTHGIFVQKDNKDDKTTQRHRHLILYNTKHNHNKSFVHGFLFADSFVAPAMWSTKSDSAVRELTR